MTRVLVCAGVVAWASVVCCAARLSAQTAAAAAQTTSTAPAAESPEIAKGRLVVAQACTTCHTTLGRMLQVHRQTADQWKDIVYFMISRGAQVMPDEIDAVAAYLADTSARARSDVRGAGDRRN